MIREVCLFDKFSFCKNGVKCTRVHLKEVCQDRECDYRNCNKRHPRPCRIFRMNSFCKFGTSCRYSHRLPKEVEEQNKKIESIEKANSMLSKQVEDQNDTIKELKSRLIEIENRELKSLQKQINELAKNISEKETAIQNYRVLGEETHDREEEQDQIYAADDECQAEKIKEATIELAQKWLVPIDNTEAEIKKIRKNAKDSKKCVQTKCKNLDDQLDEMPIDQELCEDVSEQMFMLQDCLFSPVESKETSLAKITACKNYLKDFLNEPRRPPQTPLDNCCNKCLLKSKLL